MEENIRYVSDVRGNAVTVIVPIDLWREIDRKRDRLPAYERNNETPTNRGTRSTGRLFDGDGTRESWSLSWRGGPAAIVEKKRQSSGGLPSFFMAIYGHSRRSRYSAEYRSNSHNY